MSTADHQQQRGVAWDIIDEAIADYDQWMLDDDFDAQRTLMRIINRMRARRFDYGRTPSLSPHLDR